MTFPDRAQCFLLVNLPDASVSRSQGRLDRDLLLLRCYCSRIFTSEEEAGANSFRVIVASRPGKQQPPGNQPRPLKVILSIADAARAVPHCAHKLKGAMMRIVRHLSRPSAAAKTSYHGSTRTLVEGQNSPRYSGFPSSEVETTPALGATGSINNTCVPIGPVISPQYISGGDNTMT
ncbi:hypothetical protein FGIG_02451 [Fasciola gigantica]|uniref:Uncharacterized protein n=1 Tax=Fasciola gigantica TaxID=46835 RepID=A0A504YEV2_FASGI|nr:hypothetical protein FGIG_02451 [Fasciola gigantica]